MKTKKRTIEYNQQDYIEKHYLHGNNAIIPIRIEDISQLYNEYDYQNLTMDDELISYIDNITYLIPLKYDITLKFYTPYLNKEEQDKICRMIKFNYSMDIDDIEYNIKLNFWKSIALFLVGLLILMIVSLLSPYIGFMLNECLAVASWVAIWDAVETFFVENSNLKHKKNHLLQLYDVKVEFIIGDSINENH